MQTTVTLTKHYQDSGTRNDGTGWTRNDFVAEDGARYKTFDGDIASKAKALLGVQSVVTYSIKERGQYVDNILEDIAPVSGAAPAPAPQQPNGQPTAAADDRAAAKQEVINRSAGLARAIEWFGVTGESLVVATDDGSLFQLALLFARFCETGEFGAASPSSVGAVTEGAVA